MNRLFCCIMIIILKAFLIPVLFEQIFAGLRQQAAAWFNLHRHFLKCSASSRYRLLLRNRGIFQRRFLCR